MGYYQGFSSVADAISNLMGARDAHALQPYKIRSIQATIDDLNETTRTAKFINDILAKSADKHQNVLDDLEKSISQSSTPQQVTDARVAAVNRATQGVGPAVENQFGSYLDTLVGKAQVPASAGTQGLNAVQQVIDSGFGSGTAAAIAGSQALNGSAPSGASALSSAMRDAGIGIGSLVGATGANAGLSWLSGLAGAGETDLLRRQLLTEAGLHLGTRAAPAAADVAASLAPDAVDAWTAALQGAGAGMANEAPAFGVANELPIMGSAELGLAGEMSALPAALRGLGSALGRAAPWLGAASIPFQIRDILAAPGENYAKAQAFAAAFEQNPKLFGGSDTVLLPTGHTLKRNPKTGKVTITMRQLEK